MAAETFRIEIPIHVEDNTDPGVTQATRKINGFDKANQKTQERLNQMNRTRYQVVLSALDKASSIIGSVSTKARSIAGRTYSFTMKVVDMATAPLKSIWNFATSLQGVILGGGLTAVGFKGLQLSGEMDRAKKSIDFFTGSAEEGTKAFQELVNQAIKSPLYEVPFVVQTAGQLLAAGKNIEFVKRALKDFEQTAYYTGASLSQIELAFYGFKQISSVGTLQMEELRQVTENLNLPLQWVIEELGLTGKAAKNLGDAAIPANEAMEAILKTMEKRFPAKDMQDDLLALESALKETGRMFLWAFGRGMSGPVMRIMQDLSAQLDPTGKKFNSFAGSLEHAGKVVGEKLEQIYKDVKEFLDKFNQGEFKNMGLGDKIIYGIEYGLDEASKWLQGAGGKKVEKVFVEMAEIAGRAWMTALGASLKGAGNAAREGNWSGAAALGGMAWMLGAGTLLGIVGKGGKAAIAGGKGLWKAGKWLFGKGSKAADAAADATKVAGAAAGAVDGAAGIAKTTKNLKDAAESFRAAANASKEAEKAVKTAEILKAAKQADLEKNARLLKELKKEAAKFGDDIPKGLSGKIKAADKAVIKGRIDVKKAASHLDNMVNMKNFKALEYANAREGFVVAKDVANAAKAADQVGGAASKTGILGKITGWLGKNGEDVLKAGSKFAGKGIKGIPVLGTLLGLAASGTVVASAAPENRGREAAGEVGSWLGAIGAGAGAGALVGTLGGGPIGTAVGGIAGAIGGAIGGEAFTEWLYDKKDAIASMGEKVKTAISDFGTKAGESISGFFTETIPNFVTEQIPYAVGYATGAIGTFFTATLPQEWNDFWTAVGNFFTETIPAWANGAYNSSVNFFTVSVPTFFTDLWNSVYGFFTETMPDWAAGAYDKTNEFFTQKVPEFFDGLWNSVSTFVTESIPEHAKELKDKITGWFGNFKDWASDIWDKVKSSFSTGYEAGSGSSGGSSVLKHAYGGIMTKPHMGIVAEAGPEAIIPLSGEKRQRGIELWQRTGELLGVRPYADGGIVGQAGTLNTVNTVSSGGSSVLKHAHGGIMTKPHMGIVAEAGPEAIIPLSGEKRQRGIELWQRTGELLGVRPYADGGIVGQAGTLNTVNTVSSGGSSVLKHAHGGIMTKPHMGIVAEAGPEAIIPLSGEKRQRGIELWQRTGELLGVRLYADGGIVGQAGTLNAVNTVGAAVSQVTDVSKTIADLIEKVDVSKMLRPLGQAAKTIGKGINKIGYGADAVFKRLPVIGAGMMIGSAALDIASAEDKKQAVATNTGSILGSIAGGFAGGAALGAVGGAILGPPGAAIGGAIGGIAGGIGGAIGGEAFAEWVYGQRDKIEKAFGEAWENVKAGATTAGAWLGEQFTAAKNAVGEAWSGASGWFEENVWGPIKTGATAAWNWVEEKLGGIGDWVGDKWTSFKDWLGGLGQKGSKSTGQTTSQGKGSVLKHAHGGIMTKPHMGIVAEAGAEGIIPLSPSKRSQGIDIWQRVGEKLGVQAYGDGGIVGNETADVSTAAPAERSGQSISVKVEVSANPTFTIEGRDNADESKILAVLKAYIREMADDIGDELAERLARIFANMPVKGGA